MYSRLVCVPASEHTLNNVPTMTSQICLDICFQFKVILHVGMTKLFLFFKYHITDIACLTLLQIVLLSNIPTYHTTRALVPPTVFI